MKKFLGAIVLVAAMGFLPTAQAQETGIKVLSVRVMADDPEALAVFYSKAFGMSEVLRPVDTVTFKEIVLNSGSTRELAMASKDTPMIVASRGKGPAAGGMAVLLLEVPDMDVAIARATAAGAKLLRPVAKTPLGRSYAFLTDPDGNQFELMLKE